MAEVDLRRCVLSHEVNRGCMFEAKKMEENKGGSSQNKDAKFLFMTSLRRLRKTYVNSPSLSVEQLPCGGETRRAKSVEENLAEHNREKSCQNAISCRRCHSEGITVNGKPVFTVLSTAIITPFKERINPK